jgi:putative MATE family efflux protein
MTSELASTPPAPCTVGGRVLGGRLPLTVARFGLPLALGMGLQTTFNLVDAYLLAQLPGAIAAPALGAIGVCDQLAALGSIVSYGLSVAASAFVSRHQGAGRYPALQRVAWQSLWLVLALGLLFAAVGALWSRTLLVDVMGVKGQVAALGVPYLRLMLVGNWTIFLLLHLTTLQRALGSSKTPVALLLGSNALNFFLAVLLVFGPGPAPAAFAWGPPIAAALGLPRMELMGAAWATVIARAVVLVPVLLLTVHRYKVLTWGSFVLPRRAELIKLLQTAWPSSAQLVVRVGAMLVLHSLVARAFTTAQDQSATTALGVVFRFETMALFVSLGWGSAAQTLVGQSLGAKDRRRALGAGWWAAAYDAVTMALLAGVYFLFAPQIVAWFDTTEQVAVQSISYLRIVSFSYIGLGIGIVLGAAMQGAGATRRSLMIDLTLVLGLQLPLAFAVTRLPQTSLAALWVTIAACYSLSAVLYGLAYRRGQHLLRWLG